MVIICCVFIVSVYSISLSIYLYLLYLSTYIYLYRLDDFDNSCAAYNKAIELSQNDDFVCLLNYAITLYCNDEIERCREYYARFTVCFENVTEQHDIDPEVFEQANLLKSALTRG